MVTKNDITGKEIKTGVNTNSYRNGWDLIFGKSFQKYSEKNIDNILNIQNNPNPQVSQKDEVFSSNI